MPTEYFRQHEQFSAPPAAQQSAASNRRPMTVDCVRTPDGKLSRKTERLGGKTDEYAYTFDNKGRLTDVRLNGHPLETYRYNASGQRILQVCHHGGLRQNERQYRYNSNGALAHAGRAEFYYDRNGALGQRCDDNGTIFFEYGNGSRLDTAQQRDGWEIRYEYGPLAPQPIRRFKYGRLIHEYIWLDPTRLSVCRDHDENIEYQFFYDKNGKLDRLRLVNLLHIDPRASGGMWGNPMPAGSAEDKARLKAARLDSFYEAMARNNRKSPRSLFDDSYAPREFLCCVDQVGTLRALVTLNGAVIKEIRRDSFGIPYHDSFPGFALPIGFAGGLEDPDTGLVRFGWRDYDPTIGRFTALDPARDRRGDGDLYDYCMDDPVSRVDPTGLWSKENFDESKVSRDGLGQFASTPGGRSAGSGSGGGGGGGDGASGGGAIPAGPESRLASDPAGHVAELLGEEGIRELSESRITRSLGIQAKLGEGENVCPRVLPKARAAEIKKTYNSLDGPQQKAGFLREAAVSAGRYAAAVFAEAGLPPGVAAFVRLLPDMSPDSTAKLVTSAENTLESLGLAGEQAATIRQWVAASPLTQALKTVADLMPGDDGKPVGKVISTLETAVALGCRLTALENRIARDSKRQMEENAIAAAWSGHPGGQPDGGANGQTAGAQTSPAWPMRPETLDPASPAGAGQGFAWERSASEQFQHEFSVGTRGIVDGVVNAADFIATPARLVLQAGNWLIGGDPRTFDPIGGRVSDAMGLHKPENTVEEIGHAVNKGGAAGLLFPWGANFLLSQKAATTAPNMFWNSVKLFSENLSAQVGGGAGAELGLMGAEKAGFGPVGQLAASLGAAILGGTAGNAAAGMASRAGQLFSAKEFTDSAARILGLNTEGGLTGAIRARVRTLSEKLAGIAEQTGLHPEAVTKIASERPHIKEALLSEKALSPQILEEMRQVRDGYRRVKTDPLGGPHDEVLAALSPEGLKQVFLERGPAIMRNGEIVVQGRALKNEGLSKRGFGLVKIIFRHGEKGNKRPDMPLVQEEDVVNLPRYIREFEPIKEANTYRWVIPRKDGYRLIIVLGENPKSTGMRLVTMFVDNPDIPVSKSVTPPDTPQ